MTTYRRRSITLLVMGVACFLCAALLLIALLSGCAQETVASPPPSPLLTELPPPNWDDSPIRTPSPRSNGTLTLTLPLAYNCECNCAPTATTTPTPTLPPPVTTTVEILDCEGMVADVEWLHAYFGAVTWTDTPTNTAHLTRLLAACGDAPAVLVAHVADEDGDPVENATVVLHWTDAPMLPLELRACGLDRGVYGPTNINGDIGFGMGGGSYYWPPAAGPHTMWIGGVGGTACLAGLGMVGETNHHHLDSHWRLPNAMIAGLRDFGFSEGSVVYPVEREGERMWVIQVP